MPTTGVESTVVAKEGSLAPTVEGTATEGRDLEGPAGVSRG